MEATEVEAEAAVVGMAGNTQLDSVNWAITEAKTSRAVVTD